MTVGIGAGSRIIRRSWTGSFNGIAVSFTSSKFVLHQFLFSKHIFFRQSNIRVEVRQDGQR